MRVADLVDAARTRSGLEDFGDDAFREPLEKLVGSINAESGISAFGTAGGSSHPWTYP